MCVSVCVCEERELAAISPAGLTSDTQHLQILCQIKEKRSPLAEAEVARGLAIIDIRI